MCVVGSISFSSSLPSCALFVLRGRPLLVAKEDGSGPLEEAVIPLAYASDDSQLL